MPGEALEVGGDQVFELFQVLRTIAQGREVQAGAVGMQVREAKRKLDTAVLLINTDGQFVSKLRAQEADIACGCGGDDIARSDARRADALAPAGVGMTLGCQIAQRAVSVEGRPLRNSA